MWDAITDALDDQTSRTADKLRHFEAAPDGRMWQHIEEELDGAATPAQRTIPFYKRYATPLRYAGAAAVLLLVAVTITLFVNKRSDSTRVAVQPSVSQPARQAAQPAEQTLTEHQSAPTHPQPAHTQPKSSEKLSTSGTTSIATNNATEIKTAPRPAANRYLTVATQTGKAVRLSKKVYPVFDCAEHSDALERFQCQENIENLQKMASSLISPSGDFASLMDMIKTLEENR